MPRRRCSNLSDLSNMHLMCTSWVPRNRGLCSRSEDCTLGFTVPGKLWQSSTIVLLDRLIPATMPLRTSGLPLGSKGCRSATLERPGPISAKAWKVLGCKGSCEQQLTFI
jgi:hypothetical protein